VHSDRVGLRELRRLLPAPVHPTVITTPARHAPGHRSGRPRVLVFHGGMVRSELPEWVVDPGYLRVLWVYSHLVRTLALRRVVVSLVRNRLMGWNGLDGATPDPVLDARHVLDRIVAADPDAPIVLVGHSMGGRTAVSVADHPNVVGVVALAPWIEPGDSVLPLVGRSLFVVHGTIDGSTSPANSLEFARAARAAGVPVARVEVKGVGHAMVRRNRQIHAWTTAAAAEMFGLVGVHGVDQVRTMLRGVDDDSLVGMPRLRH
jgi:acetyl esterase/lipase